MISLRLPKDMEEKLTEISVAKNKTKTYIIKESLEMYLRSQEPAVSPFELGKKYFGKYSSGRTDNSVNFKERISEKIRRKHHL